MATSKSTDEIYQLPVWILQIIPTIWRSLLVRSDSSISDLHYTLQIAIGWSDEHLNQFRIHGQSYGTHGHCVRSSEMNSIFMLSVSLSACLKGT
jgi:hypothetical protein